MNNIDLLEFGGAGQRPFVVRHLGYDLPLEDPREHGFQWVLMALATGTTPGIPQDLPTWKRTLAFDRWAAAWDLPNFEDGRRLAYIVDHYRGAVVFDLRAHAGVDLGDLWRGRRWRTLLDLIDRLPGHSHYAAAVANDEEHARLLAEALAARESSGQPAESAGPSLLTWTPEVAAITRATDAINQVRYAIIATNSKKPGDPPKPEQRPRTAIEAAIKRAERQRRQTAHEALVARVLPHKAAVKP